jgi:diguanylate cyclase (GGDEF)-like protein
MLTNRGYNSNEANDFSLNLKDSFIWDYTSGDLRDVRIINDIEKYIDSGFKASPTTTSKEPIKSTLMLPLYFENKLKWILSFDSTKNNIFTKADILVAKYICEELPILYRVFNIYQQSKRLARYDALTGFMNFDSFETALNEAIEVSYNHHEDFSVLLFELTELSTICNRFGHDIGDNYIIRFSKILKSHFLESYMMYRTGVNKFAVIFIDSDNESLLDQIESIKLEFELANSNSHLDYISPDFKYDISIYTNDDNDNLLEISDIKLDVD